jgi:hypothetical protein
MREAEAIPVSKTRLAGIFYVLTIVFGVFAAFTPSKALTEAGNLAGSVCYVAVTLLFYVIFKPVNGWLSLAAALISLAGCALGAMDALHVNPIHMNTIILFGFYCPIIGYLIFRSGFMPRILGVLFALAGAGWLTYLSPALGKQLGMATMATGLLGEGSVTVWLLVARERTAPRVGQAQSA